MPSPEMFQKSLAKFEVDEDIISQIKEGYVALSIDEKFQRAEI